MAQSPAPSVEVPDPPDLVVGEHSCLQVSSQVQGLGVLEPHPRLVVALRVDQRGEEGEGQGVLS